MIVILIVKMSFLKKLFISTIILLRESLLQNHNNGNGQVQAGTKEKEM